MILMTLAMLMYNRMKRKYPMYIDTKSFSYGPPTIGDDITIRSFNRSYTVTFSNTEVPNEKVLVIDEKVYRLNRRTYESFEHKYIVKAHEKNKTIDTSTDLINFLTRINFKKTDGLLVVGGGITQDLASFTAAIYKRGVRWTFMPTTLLSMCDSCIGSKSCLNVDGSKNQVGTFFAPSRVVINLKFLNTLEPEDVESGLGEIYKLYAIGGLDWEGVECGEESIRMALSIKKAVIEVDEFETGPRAGLNYGHTFGHVFETLSNFKIPHGVAVMMGMYVVDRYFEQDVSKYDPHLPLIRKYLKHLNQDEELIFQHLSRDKKASGTNIQLIRCEKGRTSFVRTPLTRETVKRVVRSLNIRPSVPPPRISNAGAINSYLGAPAGWI